MSDSLAKCLSQVVSSEELFHAHVCNPAGEPLEFVAESLRWEGTKNFKRSQVVTEKPRQACLTGLW
jgi:hypothetical protein